jgi:hypothetical protein
MQQREYLILQLAMAKSLLTKSVNILIAAGKKQNEIVTY